MSIHFGSPAVHSVRERGRQYLKASRFELASNVDRMMAYLLGAEWLGMMLVALLVAPRAWEGASSRMHPHLLATILSGPLFILPAIAVALICPGCSFTRHVIAVAQMLVSAVLVDATGGRIETHFHVFGSLAFLAFYRDWRVLATASLVTALDHFIGGIWLPRSVYGLLTVSPYLWMEHVWWVLFEDCVLMLACHQSHKEMSEMANARASLYEGAYHDVLTGLPNRRLLQSHFDAGIRTRPRAVLFVDLDRFKQANDTLGHKVGDELLTRVGARLSSCLRGGQMLARIGGDEFIVLLDGVGQSDSMSVGGRLLDSLNEPFEIGGHQLLLSATIGISLAPDHGSDLATLQERADQAMYRAKSGGRNRVTMFSPEVTLPVEPLEDAAGDLNSYLALRGQERSFRSENGSLKALT